MAKQPQRTMTSKCVCGAVEIETYGKPLAHVACYCDDCQEAAKLLAEMPNAPALLDDDSATHVVLVRADRYRVTKGAEQLRQHRLRERTRTYRAYTSCCHTPLFIGFDRGPHWISLYTRNCEGAVPKLEARLQTRFRPEGKPLPTDAPSYKTYPKGIVLRLVWSRGMMRLGL